MDPKENITQYSQEYIRYLTEVLKNLDHAAIEEIIRVFEEAYETGHSVYFAGNGGSAATCAHFVNDFNAVFLKLGMKAMNLTDLTANTATVTAIANDTGYENIFLNQIKDRINPRDVLVVVSASGNSLNLITAAFYAKKAKARVIGLLGFDGGKLKNICDTVFIAKTPTGQYGPVEDIHLVLNHLITSYLFSKFSGDKELPILKLDELTEIKSPSFFTR